MPHSVSHSRLPDTGLVCLVLVARVLGLAADAEQLRHRLAVSGNRASAADILRAARHLGLKAREISSDWNRLEKTPLPALAQHRDGHWLVIARADAERVLVQDPLEARPSDTPAKTVRTRLARQVDSAHAPRATRRRQHPFRFPLVYPGAAQIPQTVRRSAARFVFPAAVRPDHTAVLPGGHRQGAGAQGPDHPRRAGLRADCRVDLRGPAGWSAHLCVFAHHQPRRCRARVPALPAPAQPADELLRGPPRGRLGGAGARTGEYSEFHHRVGADAGYRPAVHLRVPGGDVLLQSAADLYRFGLDSGLRPAVRVRHARAACPRQRKIQPRCREPGVSGRIGQRRGNAQGHVHRTADAAALGRAAGRLCARQLQGLEPGQHRQPGGRASSTRWSLC